MGEGNNTVAPTDNDTLREMVEDLRTHAYDDCGERYIPTHIGHQAAEAITQLQAKVERLEGALEPFARIKPSTLYPADGSEGERYCVLLAPMGGSPVEFTGADLAAARNALSDKVGG